MKALFLFPLIVGCHSTPVWSHREVVENYDTLQKNLWCPMKIKEGGYRVVSVDGKYIQPPTKHEN